MKAGAFFFYMIRTAILVDGGFYRCRIRTKRQESPEDAANTLFQYCQRLLRSFKNEECFLYRVLYYDCRPSFKKVYHPLLRKTVDLGKEPQFRWNAAFLDALCSKRKFALRLGRLADEQARYLLKPDATKDLLSGKRAIVDLTVNDFSISIKQKGVDTRIGIDIVTMALKHQVDRIILIAGDSDFVPAAKFARREGIDVVLDPMNSPIKPELSEHIDGLKTVINSFSTNQSEFSAPEE